MGGKDVDDTAVGLEKSNAPDVQQTAPVPEHSFHAIILRSLQFIQCPRRFRFMVRRLAAYFELGLK